jgi:hypothetical protein
MLYVEMSKELDLAGFSDANGLMGRPVPNGRIIVPEKVWLKGDCIHWRWGKYPQRREVSRSMLNQFIRLKDANAILHFARKWGVLALSGNLWTGNDPNGKHYLPGRQEIRAGVESISAWQYYSRRAQAVMNVAAALKQRKLGDMSDWDEFAFLFSEPNHQQRAIQKAQERMERDIFGLGFSLFYGEGTNEERLKAARETIAAEITDWFDCWKRSSTRGISDLALNWRDDQQLWALEIDYHGLLFPAIALQLALVLADADSLYTCSGCGLPYVRPRERKRPKSGWANYCDQCSKSGVAQRRAVETYREKRAEAVRLRLEGSTVSEIAEQLNTEDARVSAWLEKGGKNANRKTRKQ